MAYFPLEASTDGHQDGDNLEPKSLLQQLLIFVSCHQFLIPFHFSFWRHGDRSNQCFLAGIKVARTRSAPWI